VSDPTPSRGMTVARVVLIAGGLGFLGLGGLVLLLDVNPARYLGIALWFAGAIVVHDALIAPGVFVAGVVLRRLGRKLPGVVLAIIQGAIVVLAIVTAIVVPEILKKEIGSANPTILPLDYLPNLLALYLAVALATLAAIVVYVVVAARRAKPRSPITQD
jgi:branched-subunit amino acid transport protein